MQTTQLSPTLQIGSQGAAVRKLQELLNRRVSQTYAVIVDGIFGPRTEAAVKAFQYSKLLRRDGVVGDKTWKALETNLLPALPVIRRGSFGESVSIAQQVLKDAGYYSGVVDSDFGAKTEAAVRSYQNGKRLLADGVIGNQTWAALGSSATFLAFD